MAGINKTSCSTSCARHASNSGIASVSRKGDFAGGHCILKDQQLLVVNKRFSIERKLATIARAIGEIGIDGVFLKSAVRTFIEDEWSKTA
ncbi:MAG: hypothetical protein IPP94_17315 [Ignavibacteria bacterium]|nr:hypothetical protein [Ignavibacteria bacterium]